jgi:cobalt-precorrin-5B (C1)-methyltransferase
MMKKMEKDPKEMRKGYTTGACATATTKAALLALITQEYQSEATTILPIGEQVTFQMERCEWTTDMGMAGTIKDAGDDPDATHKALIISTVTWSEREGIELDGGVGVGRATKPGLPIEVGEAAINPVPSRTIREVAEEVLKEYGVRRGIRIVISVPQGEEMAKKTLNERLGIVGGISILGTRGTVVPFSTSAYKASIVQAISVAKAGGCEHVVITTGGRSEKCAMEMLPELPEEAFVEMGDFVGFTLLQCKRQQMKKVTLVGMMGKFSKVAQGIMMVHSKSAPVDFGFLAQLAAEVGATNDIVDQVANANTASQVGDLMLENGYLPFFVKLCENCCRASLDQVKGGIEVETAIFTMKGQLLGRAELR